MAYDLLSGCRADGGDVSGGGAGSGQMELAEDLRREACFLQGRWWWWV